MQPGDHWLTVFGRGGERIESFRERGRRYSPLFKQLQKFPVRVRRQAFRESDAVAEESQMSLPADSRIEQPYAAGGGIPRVCVNLETRIPLARVEVGKIRVC